MTRSDITEAEAADLSNEFVPDEFISSESAPISVGKPVHVMLDLETLDTKETAVILSIGAVRFDPMGTGVIDGFHQAIDPRDAQQYGRTIDAGTVLWWMHPDRDAARKEWLEMPQVDLFTALDGFAMWLNAGPKLAGMWGNGVGFDNAILRCSYQAVGLDVPWKFSQDRDHRTIKMLSPHIKLERNGTHHNALVDATNQAVQVQRIILPLGITL